MVDDFKFEDDDNRPDPLDDDYDPFAGTETTGTVVRDQYNTNLYNGPEVMEPAVEVLKAKPRDTVEIVAEDGEVVEETADTPIPKSLPIVYDEVSASFKPNTPAPAKANAIKVWVSAYHTTPMFLGDLFLQLYREDKVSYEEMASQFGLKSGTVKNYSSWANRVPPANRVKGMTVTIWQEAASIRDLEEQRDFILKAVNGDFTKNQLRAIKDGEDPDDTPDTDGEQVEKCKCPTCGTMVRAELLE